MEADFEYVTSGIRCKDILLHHVTGYQYRCVEIRRVEHTFRMVASPLTMAVTV